MWRGLTKILEITHYSKENEILWQGKNILNLLHTDGEEYILRVLFDAEPIPDMYFLGLDNRTSITAADTISVAAETEPVGNGYTRKPFLSVGEVTFALTDDGFTQAQTPILQFNAAGGSWGPVNNIFMATTADNSGFLIASANLSTEVTLNDGEKVTVRMGLAMRDC